MKSPTFSPPALSPASVTSSAVVFTALLGCPWRVLCIFSGFGGLYESPAPFLPAPAEAQRVCELRFTNNMYTSFCGGWLRLVAGDHNFRTVYADLSLDLLKTHPATMIFPTCLQKQKTCFSFKFGTRAQ